MSYKGRRIHCCSSPEILVWLRSLFPYMKLLLWGNIIPWEELTVKCIITSGMGWPRKGYWRNKLTWPTPIFSSAFPFLVSLYCLQKLFYLLALLSHLSLYMNEIPDLYSIWIQCLNICWLATGIMFCLHGFLFLSLTFHLLGQTNKCFSQVLLNSYHTRQ